MTRLPTPASVDDALHGAVLERYGATFGHGERAWRAWTVAASDLAPAVPAAGYGPDDVLLADGECDPGTLDAIGAAGAIAIVTEREGGQWIDTVRSPMGTWVFASPSDHDTAHAPGFVAVLLACLSMHFPAHDALCLARAWQAGSLEWPDDFSRFPRVCHPALVAPGESVEAFPACPTQLGLYAVVPDAEWIEQLVPLAVPTLQLRFKSAHAQAVRAQIDRAAGAARGSACRLFINDHWRAALEYREQHGPDCGIYGIHLGQEDLDETDLPALRASGLRLGVSTHGYAEMLRVATLRPSYLALGAIFPTTTKVMPTQPQGLGRFHAYVRLMRSQVPALVGIGGVDAGNLPQVLAAGVGSAAVVRAITEAADVPEAVAGLMAVFHAARR